MAAGLLGGGNFGQAAARGLSAYSDTMSEANKAAMLKEERDYIKQQRESKAAQDQREEAERLRIQQVLRGALGGATPQQAMGMGGQLGPTQARADTIGRRQPLDANALIAQGVPIETVKQLFEAQNLGRSKVARTIKGMGPDGREMEYQVDEFGQRVGDGMAQYRAPLSVNQGDRQTFVDPYSLKPQGSFGINETPDGRASRAVTMRGQNMTDARARERFAFDQSTAARGGGNPRTGPMSVTLQKELLESDDIIQSSGSVVRALQTAKAQNEKAYEGYFAKGRAQLVSNLGGSEAADATIDIDNLMTGQGLDQMKAIFGAAPTEGERKILMDMQASVDKTPKQREAIMDRAIAAAQRRATFAKSKAQAIRDGSYLTEGVRLPETPADSNAQPLPANPTASSLTKGTVYETPRGNATWDGMKFNLVK